jgi:hypothetical protein
MTMTKHASIEDDFRRLTRRAWDSGNVKLAIELEATAYRCLGLNLNAEREARLSATGHGLERYAAVGRESEAKAVQAGAR